MIGGWNGVIEMVLMDLTWFFKKLQGCNYLFQRLPGLFYTLKLNSKSLIWLDEQNGTRDRPFPLAVCRWITQRWSSEFGTPTSELTRGGQDPQVYLYDG